MESTDKTGEWLLLSFSLAHMIIHLHVPQKYSTMIIICQPLDKHPFSAPTRQYNNYY